MLIGWINLVSRRPVRQEPPNIVIILPSNGVGVDLKKKLSSLPMLGMLVMLPMRIRKSSSLPSYLMGVRDRPGPPQ
jgi:hypothetical protein